MTDVRKTYGVGGAGLQGSGDALHPPIQEVLRGLIDDQAAGTAATIASPDGVDAAGAAPDAAEFDAVVLLVNEIKAALNAASAAVPTVVKKG